MDPQEHSFTRTIDEEAELEERADREREEGHQEQDDEEEDREHEVMTAGSEFICLLEFSKYWVFIFCCFVYSSALIKAINVILTGFMLNAVLLEFYCRNITFFSCILE